MMRDAPMSPVPLPTATMRPPAIATWPGAETATASSVHAAMRTLRISRSTMSCLAQQSRARRDEAALRVVVQGMATLDDEPPPADPHLVDRGAGGPCIDVAGQALRRGEPVAGAAIG